MKYTVKSFIYVRGVFSDIQKSDRAYVNYSTLIFSHTAVIMSVFIYPPFPPLLKKMQEIC